jgi:hypothetical protein
VLVFVNCLTVVAIDGTVTTTRLEAGLELDHRIGDLIPDGAGGSWRVEELVHEQRHLVVSEVAVEPRLVELLAA